LARELNERFVARAEIHPNRIVFHTSDEMRALQGVGSELKERKLVDHRPTAASVAGVPPAISAAGVPPATTPSETVAAHMAAGTAAPQPLRILENAA
ncbi:MAG TPA: hypothetical protein VNT99_05015, partial [Methylomirabilota bacterium]|nr:hypothetical protein [Methylomirabilota bacterium]